MSNAWNFERRRIVCAKFLVGVSLVVKGNANVATSLEAVRNRMRLPPEDALFAARRLSEEQLIAFDPGGEVHSVSAGLTRATEIVRTAISQNTQADDVTRTVQSGGIPLEMLKLALLANGGVLECAPPASDAGGDYRVVLEDDVVAVQRKNPDGI